MNINTKNIPRKKDNMMKLSTVNSSLGNIDVLGQPSKDVTVVFLKRQKNSLFSRGWKF